MPHRLKHRQAKIQAKRKQTPWREFVMEICSWNPLVLSKINSHLSRYPNTNRTPPLVESNTFQQSRLDGLPSQKVSNGEGFFAQFEKLRNQVPRAYVMHDFENHNATFTDTTYGAKNAYLSIGIGLNVENIFYSYSVNSNCSNVFNSAKIVQNCENIFSTTFATNSFNIFYSKNIQNSSNIWFSSNLVGCSECIACNSLTNQSYCIRNKSYEKEEYLTLKKTILSKKETFESRHTTVITTPITNLITENCTGSGLFICSNVTNGFIANHVNTGNNVAIFDGTSQSSYIYDCFAAGINCEHFYGVLNSGYNMSHIYCSADVGTSQNIYYSLNLHDSHHCLGCIGLQGKSYCIFNTQYTKEERYDEVDIIFSQMDQDGILGRFFPGSINPFYFNDTAAYLLDDSFTKEEVEAIGYLWRDKVIQVDIPQGVEVVKTSELDEYEGWENIMSFIAKRSESEESFEAQTGSGNSQDPMATPLDDDKHRTINPDILKKVIQDGQGNIYRIVKMEYDFLIKHGLPLPRKHRLNRIKQHFMIGE